MLNSTFFPPRVAKLNFFPPRIAKLKNFKNQHFPSKNCKTLFVFFRELLNFNSKNLTTQLQNYTLKLELNCFLLMFQNYQTRFNFQIDFCQKWEKCKAWLRRNTEQYLEGGSTDQNRKGLRESLFSTVPLLKRFHIHGGALEITSILQLPRFWRRRYPSTNPPCPHNRIYTKWLAQGIDKYLKYLNRP